VDADHSEAACRQDIEACLRLVKAGGQLAFHDWQEDTCPGVTAALKAGFPDGPKAVVDTLFVVDRRAIGRRPSAGNCSTFVTAVIRST
jgi:hypothetical protein